MYHGNIKLATTHILSVFSLRRLIRRSIESTKPPHVCTSVLCSTAKLSWSFNTYCLTLSLDHEASVSLFNCPITDTERDPSRRVEVEE